MCLRWETEMFNRSPYQNNRKKSFKDFQNACFAKFCRSPFGKRWMELNKMTQVFVATGCSNIIKDYANCNS